MARKEKIVMLQDGDEQKKFKIRQMGAIGSEWFFLQLSDEMARRKMLEDDIKTIDGISAIISLCATRNDMLEKLLECCSRVHEGGIETQLNTENADAYIDDFRTLIKLRMEAFAINGFFQRLGENGSIKLDEFPAPDIMIKHQK